MDEKMAKRDWQNAFLEDLLDSTSIKAEIIPADFEDSFNESLGILSDFDADILRRHYVDNLSYREIAKSQGVSGAWIGKRCLEALDIIRQSPFIYSLAWGKEYKELNDIVSENMDIINVIRAKSDLIKIFNEIRGIKDVTISDISVDDKTKAIFESLGIDNVEELLSFNLAEFITAAGAVLGESEAKRKIQFYKYSKENYRCLYVDEIGLSTRAVNCLHSNGIYKLVDLSQYAYSDIMKFAQLGDQTKNEIQNKLKEYNIRLKKGQRR